MFAMGNRPIQIPDKEKKAIPFDMHTQNMCIFQSATWYSYLQYVLEKARGIAYDKGGQHGLQTRGTAVDARTNLRKSKAMDLLF